MNPRTLLRPGDTDVAPRFPSLRRFPRLFLFGVSQVAVLLVMFQVYKIFRKTFIGHAENVAFGHAQDVLSFESRLHLEFERPLQKFVLDRPDWVIKAFNQVYANYMWIFFFGMVVGMFFAVERWRYYRRWFFISMAIATPWYAIYPLAPPRFMQPYGYDFVDTLARYGPNYFSDNGFVAANRYAAMPSMHVGWTTLAAIVIANCIPWKKTGKVIAGFLIVLITLTVMVTGNHYWLDAVAGWTVITVAALINRALPYPFPIPWPWVHPQAREVPALAPAMPVAGPTPAASRPQMQEPSGSHD
ncbi:MAG TPA: phosphatase PAP2 family protein [Thermomicrobiales bacterium]|nr:phosphatase PAP2 family protein [Thermomicrobiales bacterium]